MTQKGWKGPSHKRDHAWHRLSAKILERDGHRCCWMCESPDIRLPDYRCPEPATEVHHTQPGNDDERTLVSLCGYHHRVVSGRQAAAVRWSRGKEKRQEEPHPGMLPPGSPPWRPK